VDVVHVVIHYGTEEDYLNDLLRREMRDSTSHLLENSIASPPDRPLSKCVKPTKGLPPPRRATDIPELLRDRC
jgi:hypothetical protein